MMYHLAKGLGAPQSPCWGNLNSRSTTRSFGRSVLRDVEIGYQKGAGFARSAAMETKDEWISAAETVRLLKPVLGNDRQAQRTVCKRAHEGLIRARAEKFSIDDHGRHNIDIPKEFWWAEGESALTQDWVVGDFDTWIRHEKHWRAFGVSFHRGDRGGAAHFRDIRSPSCERGDERLRNLNLRRWMSREIAWSNNAQARN
jgi:hypothetical protein